MKARIKSLIVFVFLFTLVFGNTSLAEASPSSILDKAEIDIISDGDVGYEVTQHITINNIENIADGRIEHTLSSINSVDAINPKFSFESNNLEFSIEESGALVRYFVLTPPGVSGKFTYTISYESQLEQGDFTVPVFVPAIPSLGEGNVVTINFTTTEDKIIQRNSFPILKKDAGSEVTSYLMNIPSHVKYIFGERKSIFNLFNFVGWGSIVILLLIFYIWIRSELKQAKEVEI